jgi:hypothetical protein
VFGVGTGLYAVAIGPLVQRLLPLFTVRTGGVTRASDQFATEDFITSAAKPG